jgi:hypothetical protein
VVNRQGPVGSGFVGMTIHAPPAWWTNDEWQTPDAIVQAFEREFGVFDLDPCATDASAKAEQYYTIAEDGLRQPWFGRVWLNMPYSNPEPWLRKAVWEIRTRSWLVRAARRDAPHTLGEPEEATLVVACLPPAVDTGWFHALVLPYAEIRYHRGRIGFLNWAGQPVKNTRQGTIFAIYRRGA